MAHINSPAQPQPPAWEQEYRKQLAEANTALLMAEGSHREGDPTALTQVFLARAQVHATLAQAAASSAPHHHPVCGVCQEPF